MKTKPPDTLQLGAGGDAGPALEHDGSFSSFLCAVADSLNEVIAGRPALRICARSEHPGLFDERQPMPRDDGRAASVWSRLAHKAGVDAARTLLEAFCSDLPGADKSVAVAAARIWREGASTLNDLACPDILVVEKASQRTKAEAHLMTGLARFSELADGSWYASIQPDCDVLILIAEHFATRFPLMRWILHDRGRRKAIVHEPDRGWNVVEDFRVDEEPEHSLDENRLREAWTCYFRSVAIAERKNPRLQASHMPKKYWVDLPETQTAERGYKERSAKLLPPA